MKFSGRFSGVVIFDEGLYHGHGIVGQWCANITTKFEFHAKRYAPARTGDLRRGITGESHQTGVRQVVGTISSRAHYSLYVLQGTTGPIMTDRGFANGAAAAFEQRIIYRDVGGSYSWEPSEGARGHLIDVAQPGYFMWIPPGGKDGGKQYPGFYAIEVSGQRPNNFLVKAWAATARTHSSIRGVGLPAFLPQPPIPLG